MSFFKVFPFISFLFYILFIYLAPLGLSCSMQDLHCSLWDSLVLACRLQSLWASVSVAQRISCPGAHGILVPQPGVEPGPPALQGRFFTRPPRKSQIDVLSLLILIIISQCFCLSHHHHCVF